MTTFTILNREQILEAVAPDWLIKDILTQDSLAALYGAPESFKSFVLLDAACSVATGKPFLGKFTVRLPGDVLYVYAEGGRSFSKRLRAWEHYHGIEATRLFGVAAPVNMLSLDPERLLEDIKSKGIVPELIILDTLARCFGDGDENSTQHMNAFVRGCDMLRGPCTLVASHHTGWNAKQRPRGARALEGAADTMLECGRRGHALELTVSVRKQKDDECIPPILCQAVRVAGSLIVRAITASMSVGLHHAGEANNDLVLRVLREAGPAGMSAREMHMATHRSELTLKDVRERLHAKGLIEYRGARGHTRWHLVVAEDDTLDQP